MSQLTNYMEMADSIPRHWDTLNVLRMTEIAEPGEEEKVSERERWRERKSRSTIEQERQYNFYYKNINDIMLYRNSSLPSHGPAAVEPKWDPDGEQAWLDPNLATQGRRATQPQSAETVPTVPVNRTDRDRETLSTQQLPGLCTPSKSIVAFKSSWINCKPGWS